MKKKIAVLMILFVTLLTGCKDEPRVPIVGEFENALVITKDNGGRGVSSTIDLNIDGNKFTLIVSDTVYTMAQEGSRIDGRYNKEMRLVDVWISGTERVENSNVQQNTKN